MNQEIISDNNSNKGLSDKALLNIQAETDKGEVLILKEFSSFRTPLGNEVVKVITLPDFFTPPAMRKAGKAWPENIVNLKFKDDLFF